VNPANGELYHGGGAARAISTAARTTMDDEFRLYKTTFIGLEF